MPLTRDDWSSLVAGASHALLQPHLTSLVGSHLRPWLPELLPVLASHLYLHQTTSKKKSAEHDAFARKHANAANPQLSQANNSQKKKECVASPDSNHALSMECIDTEVIVSEKKLCKLKGLKKDTPAVALCKRPMEADMVNDVDEEQPLDLYSWQYLQMHRAVCVALSTLLAIAPDAVQQFVLQYFEKHPPPYAGLDTSFSSPEPQSKKPKPLTELLLPNTSDDCLLEVTYELVLSAERELSLLWQWDELLSFVAPSHSPTIRWLACQCIGILSHMTEAERSKLTAQHVDQDTWQKLAVFYAHKQQERQSVLTSLPNIWSEKEHICSLPSELKTKRVDDMGSKNNKNSSVKSLEKKKKGTKKNKIQEPVLEAVPLPVELTLMPLKFTNFVGKNLLPVNDTNKVLDVSSSPDGSGVLVAVSSTLANLEAVWRGVSAGRPVLLEGPVGCGKTATVEHLAALTGRRDAPFLTKVQLGEQTDSKSLLGTYRCTATPGEFVWSPGAVTRAVISGHWLLLEDIDSAQLDVVAIIATLLEDRKLLVPGAGEVQAHRNFRVFATRRLSTDGRRVGSTGGAGGRLEGLWSKVLLHCLDKQEMHHIVVTRFPRLVVIAERLVSVFITLTPGQHGTDLQPEDMIPRGGPIGSRVSTVSASGRLVCFRDLLKWGERINSYTQLEGPTLAVRAFQESTRSRDRRQRA